MIYRENPNFVAREIQPNPREVSYWIDLSESPQGQIIKTWVSGKWIKINPSDAEQGGVDLTEVKQAIADLQTNKADKYEVQEVKEEIWNDTYTKQQVDDRFDTKEDTLVSGVTIKTINGNSLLGSGNITIQAEGGDMDLSGYLTKIEADNTYQPKGVYLTSIPPQYVTETELESKGYALKTEIPNTDSFITEQEANDAYQPKGTYITSIPSEYITESELTQKGYATTDQIPDISTKQDTLVSGTNIKTINNQSILGQGNIEITTGTGGITDAPSDGTIYGRQNGNWVEVNVDTSDLATKEELESKMDVEGGEFTGTVAVPTLALMYSSQGMMYQIQSAQRETTFRTMNAGQDTVNFMVQYSTPLKLTEAGIWENGMLLENKYALLGDIPTIPTNISTFTNDAGYITSDDLTGYVTTEQLKLKQDTLVSGTNIKTINGASILGSGNITIETPEGGISDAPQDGKTYGRKDGQWSEIVIPDTSTLATKTEIADMATQTWVGEQGYLTEHQDISNLATKEELASKANTSDLSNYLTTANASTTYETISGAQSKYQPVGEYALKSEIPSLSGYATESYVNTQVSNLVNSAPETLDTLKELADALGNDANFSTTVTNLIGQKLDSSTYNEDKQTFALKAELPTDYITEADLNGYVTQTYITEQLSTKLDVSTYNDEKANFATKDDLQMSGYKINSITINGTTGEVTGDIQGDVIKWIRQNSHRYSVWADTEAADGVVIKQLDDSDSRYSSYGAGIETNKTRGNNYGIYVKIPKFYYRVTETDTQIYQIEFSVEIQLGDVSWKVYDGNELYSAYSVNANLVSTPDNYSSEIEYKNISNFQSTEGKMFRIMTWQQRCLFYVLYAAWYGSLDMETNVGPPSEYDRGDSMYDGMTDVLDQDSRYNNFWGLENFIYDFLNNYIEDIQMYSYDDHDPEFRIMNGSMRKESIDITGATSGYIARPGLKIREDLIFVPTSGESSNNIFSTIRYTKDATSQCTRRGGGIFDLHFDVSGNNTIGLGIRLTYKGRIREII